MSKGLLNIEQEDIRRMINSDLTTKPQPAAESRLSDLIERLLTLQDHYSTSGQLGEENSRIFAEAAAHIDLMKTALEMFANETCWRRDGRCDPNSSNFDGLTFARSALDAAPSPS